MNKENTMYNSNKEDTMHNSNNESIMYNSNKYKHLSHEDMRTDGSSDRRADNKDQMDLE